ncbi:hypothetical protein [Streptacidiphilus sp. MAP5-3]|uniref:hypothetical protein n=1 Tax=unclassified Streptacidiphilus TaxID=2643834 RepID=UPI003512A831
MPVAASVVGLAVAAVLALGTPLAWANEAGTGSASAGITVRLPDGHPLRFVSVRSARTPTRTPAHRPSHVPGHRPPGGVASAPPVNPAPGGPPGADPSVSALPLPVVSPLFPSPPASGKPSASSAASKEPRPGAPGRPAPGGTPSRAPGGGGSGSRSQQVVSVPVGQDAVQPIDQAPRPAASVPPPLGPQAVLPPESVQQAGPRARLAARDTGLDLGPHARMLGVGLALIGAGAALFGWRIRRL